MFKNKSFLIPLAVTGVVILGMLIPTKDNLALADEDIPNSTQEIMSKELSPQAYLRLKTTTEEFNVLNKLIRCESGWKTTAKNPDSTALGLAQFLTGTWQETRLRMKADIGDRTNPYHSIDSLIWLWRTDGSRPWLASKHCWN